MTESSDGNSEHWHQCHQNWIKWNFTISNFHCLINFCNFGVLISILHIKEISLERSYIDGPRVHRQYYEQYIKPNSVWLQIHSLIYYITLSFCPIQFGRILMLSCYCCKLIIYYWHIYYSWSEMMHCIYRQLLEKFLYLFL